MKFGDVPASEALGAVLAHSVKIDGKKFQKGLKISNNELAELIAAGVAEEVDGGKRHQLQRCHRHVRERHGLRDHS